MTDINREIYFVTKRENKVVEVGKILQGMKLLKAAIELPTWETTNLVNLAVSRVFNAYKELQGPCFIEEAALNIAGYAGPYPGHEFRRVIDDGMGKKEFAEKEKGKDATALSVIAYTKDGKIAHVFTGKMEGRIVHPEQWIEGDGWDPYFCPMDRSKGDFTLAHLQSFTNNYAARIESLCRVRQFLRGADYKGTYEVHITIYNCAQDIFKNTRENILKPSLEYWEKFKSFCEKRKIKPLYITLDDPRKPVQLQTSAYHVYPDYTTAFLKTNEIIKELISEGLYPLRMRCEAMAKNPESPKSDDETLLMDESNYFEFHASMGEKITDPVLMEKFNGILKSFCLQNIGTHGKGSLKTVWAKGGPNEEKIFANMRAYKLGVDSALECRDRLYQILTENGFAIRKKIPPELTVYDQVPTLDDQLIA